MPMSWICPWCGRENEQDERIGRREPTCRLCGEPRITPEKLQEMKDKATRNLEQNEEDISERMQSVRERLSMIEDELSEVQEKHRKVMEEYNELRADLAPVDLALSEWRNQTVHYEKIDRAFIAENDRCQKTLPFEAVLA